MEVEEKWTIEPPVCKLETTTLHSRHCCHGVDCVQSNQGGRPFMWDKQTIRVILANNSISLAINIMVTSLRIHDPFLLHPHPNSQLHHPYPLLGTGSQNGGVEEKWIMQLILYRYSIDTVQQKLDQGEECFIIAGQAAPHITSVYCFFQPKPPVAEICAQLYYVWPKLQNSISVACLVIAQVICMPQVFSSHWLP